LATISPCVQILRQLASEINSALGSRQGSKHGSPDLTEDIEELMGSLSHNGVYVLHPGRCLDEDDAGLADNVVTTGFNMLTFGSNSPLKQFNQTLATLQQRRRVKPLISPGSEQPEQEGNPFTIHDGELLCIPWSG